MMKRCTVSIVDAGGQAHGFRPAFFAGLELSCDRHCSPAGATSGRSRRGPAAPQGTMEDPQGLNAAPSIRR
jgi:hypothetical protein